MMHGQQNIKKGVITGNKMARPKKWVSYSLISAKLYLPIGPKQMTHSSPGCFSCMCWPFHLATG